MTSCPLDALSGMRVFLKCENFERVGTFKFRGAYHDAIARLMSSQPSRVFATFSSGNYAQGLALACHLRGVTAYVVMPKPFSAMKPHAVLGYGAQVHVVEDQNCADTKVRELVGDYHTVDVRPFHDAFVIAGQGTVIGKLVDQFLTISTSCWGQSAVEACSLVSVSQHRHSDRAWPSLPMSQPTPWM